MPTAFNLSYDGGIFVGWKGVEAFPEGTPVVWPSLVQGKQVGICMAQSFLGYCQVLLIWILHT